MDLPNLERASRRAFLRRSLLAGGGLAAVVLLPGCGGSDDAKSLAGSTTQAPAKAAAKASLAVTYTASGGSTGGRDGRVRNPYLAAWLEDAAGDMVALLGVTYLPREAKYLRELTAYAGKSTAVTAAQLDAVTGATRSAGSYVLAWDGLGLDGAALSGAHVLWVEAAREHGPHSVIHGPVTLGAPGTGTVPGTGELSDAVLTIA